MKKELPACPVETTLTLISNKWKILILREILLATFHKKSLPVIFALWKKMDY